MILWVWTRNDASGLLDDEFRDGDVMMTKPDSFESSIGAQEKKSWLVLKIVDPPNMARVQEELERSEYAPGPTPGDDNVVRRMRIYSVNWRSKFTSQEIAIIEDANQTLPDGATSGGGTVTSGVVSGLFTIKDFSRK